MRLIDEEYTAHPFLGYRLMHVMGLAAMVPGPNTSRPAPHNPVYPYLLRGVTIERVDQVWSCDITYLPMPKGFVYLFAVIDWFSRFVLSWEISTTLDTTFCLEGLERALCVGQPAIFNTDQGSQFTGAAFTSRLLSAGIALSMDGRGRALDNIFVERLWRTVKYEDVYLKGYATPKEVFAGLHAYFHYYNWERLHQALDYRTPAAMYYAKQATRA
jgi:putative transposase